MSKRPAGIPLAQALAVLEQIAPLELAEEWDNVGCLLAPVQPRRIRRILLTIDASPAVVDEAVKKEIDLIVAYHPPLFSSIKRLHPADALQARLLKLIEARIAVYSPHTALDAVRGGVNDWLAAMVQGQDDAQVSVMEEGPGRLVQFGKGVMPAEFIDRIRTGLGVPYLRVARPEGRLRKINRVALCAGAGFSAIAHTDADAYLTGEMKHHDILTAVAAGAWVVLSEHTHTERGYLPVLRRALEQEWPSPQVQVLLSRQDRDPVNLVTGSSADMQSASC